MPVTKPLTNEYLCEVDARARDIPSGGPHEITSIVGNSSAATFYQNCHTDIIVLVAEVRRLKDIIANATEICRPCKGSGKIYNPMGGKTDICFVCNGSGEKKT